MSATIVSPPSAQTTSRRGSTFVSKINKEPLFDVCNKGCACSQDEVSTCWTGAFAPCCLLGAAAKMRESKFTEEVSTCDGCGGVCCGIFSFNFFLGGTGAGPLIGSCLAVQCLKLYRTEQLSDYFKYIFCVTCASCADYNSALSQVKLNNNKI